MPICYIVGVDDNGAAVVSMLEVARQLTEMNRQGLKRLNTVIFVSFDIEEEGNFLKSVLNLYHSLGKFSRRQIADNFLFFTEMDFEISFKLFPKETVCRQCENLFLKK